MTIEMIIVVILSVAALIAFVWGTLISSVKHVGFGGALLSIAFILSLTFWNKL